MLGTGKGSSSQAMDGGVSTFKEVGIKKKSRTFKEVGVIKKPGLGEGPNPGLEDERGEFEIRGRPKLLGLGRYPVPSYGWGVSTGIIRLFCEGRMRGKIV
jgi:hypothetical protein